MAAAAELEALEQQFATTPDWAVLERLLDALPTAEAKRAQFEHTLARFPLAHKLWVKYIEFESQLAESQGDVLLQPLVRDLLKRTLKTSFSVDIYAFYLAWLERMHHADEFDKKQQLITDAYEEALGSVGLAIDALPVWQRYVDFLLTMPDQEQYDASIKQVALRKVFLRAICVPMRDVDLMFRQFAQFEQMSASSSSSSSSSTQQRSTQPEDYKEHVNASLVMKERDAYWRALLVQPDSVLPSANLPTAQIEAWQRMIQYELGNPENLKPITLKQKLRLCLRRAVHVCWYHVEIWLSFYELERNTDEYQAAQQVLELASVALPRSWLVRLTLADLLESNGLRDEAKQAYELLLQQHSEDDASSSLFIHFMRFNYRQFGVKASRDVFRRARAQLDCTPQLYLAMAQLELLQGGGTAQVANQVFELAMKRFPRHAELSSEYLAFMQHHVREYQACKQAYERVCDQFDAQGGAQQQQQQQAGKQEAAEADAVLYGFYTRYLQFERSSQRDMNEVLKLESRISRRFPKRVSKLQLCLRRYTPNLPLEQEGLVLFGREDAEEEEASAFGGGNRRASAAAAPSSSSASAGASKQSVLQTSKDVERIPQFLHRLAGMVPKKIAGLPLVDVDEIILKLTQGSLLRAPLAGRNAPASHYAAAPVEAAAASSRKRPMGVEGAPVDAFKQRKERRL